MYLNFTKYKENNFQYIMKADNTQEEIKNFTTSLYGEITCQLIHDKDRENNRWHENNKSKANYCKESSLI